MENDLILRNCSPDMDKKARSRNFPAPDLYRKPGPVSVITGALLSGMPGAIPAISHIGSNSHGDQDPCAAVHHGSDHIRDFLQRFTDGSKDKHHQQKREHNLIQPPRNDPCSHGWRTVRAALRAGCSCPGSCHDADDASDGSGNDGHRRSYG